MNSSNLPDTPERPQPVFDYSEHRKPGDRYDLRTLLKAVRELPRSCGMFDPAWIDNLSADLDAAESEIVRLRDANASLQAICNEYEVRLGADAKSRSASPAPEEKPHGD